MPALVDQMAAARDLGMGRHAVLRLPPDADDAGVAELLDALADDGCHIVSVGYWQEGGAVRVALLLVRRYRPGER